MGKKKMKQSTSLRQARSNPKDMKKFIREHKGDKIESDDFDKVFCSMTGSGTRSKALEASLRDADDDYT